mmetsp:Transcript_21210/g.59974  ORF Transcript_21210/g.59974 Transcript_21210/m.59974 type:complete len:368 (-) Transcript_21210:84-1187(-)
MAVHSSQGAALRERGRQLENSTVNNVPKENTHGVGDVVHAVAQGVDPPELLDLHLPGRLVLGQSSLELPGQPPARRRQAVREMDRVQHRHGGPGARGRRHGVAGVAHGHHAALEPALRWGRAPADVLALPVVFRGGDELAEVAGKVGADGAGELSEFPGEAFLGERGRIIAANQQVLPWKGEDELTAPAEEELLVLRHRGSNLLILHSAQHPLLIELWLHLQVGLNLPDAAPTAHQRHGMLCGRAVGKVDDHTILIFCHRHDLGAIQRCCLAVRSDDVGQFIAAKQDCRGVVYGDHDIAASGHDGRFGREVRGVAAQGVLQLRADLAERAHAHVLEVDVAALVGHQAACALVDRGRQAPLLRAEGEG